MTTRAAAPACRPTIVLLVGLLGVGGAERHTIALANLLSERFEIVLAYIQPDTALIDHVDAAALKRLECLQVTRGLRLQAVKRLARLIDETDAEIVVCANAYPLLYAHAARLCSRRRFRVAAVYHTTTLHSREAKLRMMFFRPLFWLADQLIYVCRAQQAFWTRRGLWSRRISMIYNGVDTAHFDPQRYLEIAAEVRRSHGFSADDRVVGVCAVFRPEKAHLDLLHAVARLNEEGLRWKVLLIGDGPTRPAVEQAVRHLDLEAQVRITGFRHDVRPEIACCDVLALVSVAVETFSIAALEAMAMGKPMILSDIGGAREQVTDADNGFVFPPGDREQLANCLRRCWDRGLNAAMGGRARQRVERDYSQQTMRDRYVEMLSALLPAASDR